MKTTLAVAMLLIASVSAHAGEMQPPGLPSGPQLNGLSADERAMRQDWREWIEPFHICRYEGRSFTSGAIIMQENRPMKCICEGWPEACSWVEVQ